MKFSNFVYLMVLCSTVFSGYLAFGFIWDAELYSAYEKAGKVGDGILGANFVLPFLYLKLLLLSVYDHRNPNKSHDFMLTILYGLAVVLMLPWAYFVLSLGLVHSLELKLSFGVIYGTMMAVFMAKFISWVKYLSRT